MVLIVPSSRKSGGTIFANQIAQVTPTTRSRSPIAAFEASPESNAFTSKYDYYLKGMVDLTNEEKRGLNLFKSKGKCAKCHVLDSALNGNPLLTDFTYDNLGVPRNPKTPSTARRISTVWVIAGSTSVWGNSWRAVGITSRLHQ